MNIVLITPEPLDVSSVQNLLTSPNCGAISLFVGVTRNNFHGKSVARLEYEAYQPMAEKRLNKICQDIRKLWPEVEKIALQHRLGLVPVSEPSVIVGVSSPHRAASLAAVSFAIEAVKASVPIWKKEVYVDGTRSWKENEECNWSGGRAEISPS